MLRRALFLAGLGLAAWSAVRGTMRVAALESKELERVTERTLAPNADENPAEPRRRLAIVRLEAGEDVLFEVCARDGFPPERWDGAVDFVVWQPDQEELVVSAPLDRRLLERASRSREGACVVVGTGKLEVAGRYAIEAVWPDRTLPAGLDRVRLRAHVIAHRPLAPSDPRYAIGILLGVVLAVFSASRWKPPGATSADPRATVKVVLGLALLAATMVGLAFVPLWGSAAGVLRGALLGAVQVAAAIFLVREARTATLGLVGPLSTSPRRGVRLAGWATLALAPLVGVGLWIAGGLVTNLVPSTGEAPIETLASWPSGALSVALVAVLLPIAEEIFFRGFVYGLAERGLGRAAAFAVTVVLFALAHLPQQWGAWGAFASVLLTGIVLTSLRAATGSILVPILAHLAHNAIIAMLVVR